MLAETPVKAFNWIPSQGLDNSDCSTASGWEAVQVDPECCHALVELPRDSQEQVKSAGLRAAEVSTKSWIAWDPELCILGVVLWLGVTGLMRGVVNTHHISGTGLGISGHGLGAAERGLKELLLA